MDLNKIYNEDSHEFMKRVKEPFADLILTSPPYNTARNFMRQDNRDRHEGRYDVYIEDKSDEEYIEWTVKTFNLFDSVLKSNGSVLYNMSYSSENTHLIWLTIAEVIKRTPFTTADLIVWKKKSALPNNMSPNKLTRITECIFVFCRKSEFKTFITNKKVVSYRSTGQPNFENVFNFIEARNNDGPTKLNKATFSSELCDKLLDIYAPQYSTVFDPFIGTGTTAVAAKRRGLKYVGCEISRQQVEYATDRLARGV